MGLTGLTKALWVGRGVILGSSEVFLSLTCKMEVQDCVFSDRFFSNCLMEILGLACWPGKGQ